MSEHELEPRSTIEIVSSERVTKIEMRMGTYEEQQVRILQKQDKHEELLNALKDKTVASDLLAVAVKDRTDVHSKNIETLQKDQIDTGKLLTKMESQIGMIRAIGATAGTILFSYIITNFHNLFH